jgi:hypothetical protein
MTAVLCHHSFFFGHDECDTEHVTAAHDMPDTALEIWWRHLKRRGDREATTETSL